MKDSIYRIVSGCLSLLGLEKLFLSGWETVTIMEKLKLTMQKVDIETCVCACMCGFASKGLGTRKRRHVS